MVDFLGSLSVSVQRPIVVNILTSYGFDGLSLFSLFDSTPPPNASSIPDICRPGTNPTSTRHTTYHATPTH